MGRDKGLVLFLGKPLITRVLERLSPIADEILITTNNLEGYRFLGVPLFSDQVTGRGALGGLYTALIAAQQPNVAVVACDMPFVNARLLAAQHERLLEKMCDIVIPDNGEGLEPFHAVYRREACLPYIKTAIDEGEWRVDAWFSQVKLETYSKTEIVKFDPELLCFINVNTEEELIEAELLAAKTNSRKV